MRFDVIPINLDEANAFVRLHHRHHGPVVGHKFSLAITQDCGDTLLGVAIVGRPVSRMLDNGLTLEIYRVATDGAKDACSCLYGACRRATFALGYKRLITYTLDTEPGTSLKAAGWRCVGSAGGGSWSRSSRPRTDKATTQAKLRWEAVPEQKEMVLP